jgi:hypothetical protein
MVATAIVTFADSVGGFSETLSEIPAAMRELM